MTLQDLINWFSAHQYITSIYFIILFLLTLLLVRNVNEKNLNQLQYAFSAIVYGVTVPGILAVLLTGYTLLILRTSLLNVSIIVYFLPIFAMAVTLFVMNKKVALKSIPGFDRITSLMVLIGITFTVVFVLQKTFFGVVFIGGFAQLLVVFILLFVILKVTWSKLTK